jgi:HTH-type transcriptional regulator/antitoxin HipB
MVVEDDSGDSRRRTWEATKQGRRVSVARRASYRQAGAAFEIAERIRHARERHGITQAELAARIGSSRPALARLEAGGMTPSFDTLRRIAEALGLELVVDLRRVRRSA